MAKAELQGLIRRMCRNLGFPGDERISDAELLERFVTQRDQAAFEVLVWRHGGMVLSVCQRVLRDGHLAEDAFQSTFLTLARKAQTIGQRASLAGWLYRVAYRIALRAGAGTSRRAAREQLGLDMPGLAANDDVFDEISHRDLQRVLDEELNQLPPRYRVPLVLCYLEGLTNEEAARQLGCPKGTIATRLARARDRLRNRLHRRGVVLSALSLGAVLLESTRPATVRAALVNVTTKAAASYVRGGAAVQATAASTFWSGTRVQAASSPAGRLLPAASKVRRAVTPAVLALVLFAGAALAGGAGVVAYYGGFAGASVSHCSGGGCRAASATPVPSWEDALVGDWLLARIETAGEIPFPTLRPGQTVHITPGKLIFSEDNAVSELPFELGAFPAIDLCPRQGPRKGDRIPGIYLSEVGRLTICCDLAPGVPRPLSVRPGPESKLILALERRPGL